MGMLGPESDCDSVSTAFPQIIDSNCCTSSMIQCSKIGRVTSINIQNHNLTGIPENLQVLDELEYLILAHNNISGSIPTWIGKLKRLIYLNLSYNNLQGDIPPEISNIRQIDLSSNLLTGSNSSKAIVSLNCLTGQLLQNPACLSTNQTTQNDQSQIDQSNSIEQSQFQSGPDQMDESQSQNNQSQIDESQHQSHAVIPSNILTPDCQILSNILPNIFNSTSDCCQALTNVVCGSDDRITSLDLHNLGLNALDWRQLVNITELKILNLEHNNLSGSLPVIELVQFKQLSQIYFGHNNFSGVLDPQIFLITSLEVISLENNYLSGNISSSLGNLNNLRHLSLSHNNFTGFVPVNITDLQQLTELKLDMNHLTGPIPGDLHLLTSASYIDLGSNKLSGNIPLEITAMPNLKTLSFANNELVGTIPNSVVTFPKLQWLNLGQNHLTGPIPSSIGFTAPELTYLNVSFNNITGQLPDSLSKLQYFRSLDVRDNLLSGTLPFWAVNWGSWSYSGDNVNKNCFQGQSGDYRNPLCDIEGIMSTSGDGGSNGSDGDNGGGSSSGRIGGGVGGSLAVLCCCGIAWYIYVKYFKKASPTRIALSNVDGKAAELWKGGVRLSRPLKTGETDATLGMDEEVQIQVVSDPIVANEANNHADMISVLSPDTNTEPPVKNGPLFEACERVNGDKSRRIRDSIFTIFGSGGNAAEQRVSGTDENQFGDNHEKNQGGDHSSGGFQLPSLVSEWTADHTARWMISRGGREETANFARSMCVNGAVLIRLTNEDICRELKCTLGERVILQEAAEYVRSLDSRPPAYEDPA